MAMQYFLVKGKRLMGLREENSKSLPKTIPLSALTEKYCMAMKLLKNM